MTTTTATTKVTKFINKFEKSQSYEDILEGSYGKYPVIFDNVKLSNNIVIYSDKLTDSAMKKRYLLLFAVKKDGRYYNRVIEKMVEIPEDMAKYVQAAENMMFEIAKEVDDKGLLK
jgi:hypothetical protein